LTKRPDFPRAKGAVRCSPFGGVEFGKTSRLGSLTSQAFTEWYKEQDIELRFIQPGKPDQNAYIERFNRTYREEVPSAYLFDSLEEVREITTECLERYNESRHTMRWEACRQRVTASVCSPRKLQLRTVY